MESELFMQATIKSFVLRAGRVSKRQQYALETWLVDYEMPKSADLWCIDEAFGRKAETIVEIGFGMGSTLLQMAEQQPEVNFIGIEVHQAGIGSLVASLHEHQIKNVRIAPFDAVEVFGTCIPDNTLKGVQIFFPDPWPKKRHQKRRLINPAFVKKLVTKLQVGGYLHCATDWKDYAESMLRVLNSESTLINQQGQGGFVPRPTYRPLTKFEQRGTRLGHAVWDLIFNRI